MRLRFSLLALVFGVSLAIQPLPLSAQNILACSDLFVATEKVERFNFFDFYWSKLKELRHLDSSAPYAVSLRLLIMVNPEKPKTILVPLGSLRSIHPVNRGEAVDKLKERIQVLKNADLLPGQPLTGEVLSEVLPSKNPMRAVRADSGEYVVFDGNGRLYALRAVIKPTTLVEVELYNSDSKLLQANLRALLDVRSEMYEFQ